MTAEEAKPTGSLLVVGGRPDTVRKAAELGLDVVLLQHRDHFAPATAALAKAVIIADYTDWDQVRPLVEAAHEAYGFTAAVSLTEPGLEPAGRAVDLLGLRGNPYEVSRLNKDKAAMRRRLAELGGPAAELSVAAADATDADALRAFGRDHGYPFVVKPTNITASLGIHKVCAEAEIPAVWAAVQELTTSPFAWGAFFELGPHLVEQWIEGPEFSVEAFSFDGRHVVVAVTEKTTAPGFVELGHTQPARIPAADEAVLVDAAITFLDAVGQRHGASHTEIKLGPGGPKVIEGHNRIGGDRIVDLLEAAYGVDFELLTVGAPFGLVEPLADRPPLRQAAATRFLLAPPGEVVAIDGVEAARAEAGVLAVDLTVEVGDTVRAGSNWDRCGQVLAVGPDADAAAGLCERLVDGITITTRPHEGARS